MICLCFETNDGNDDDDGYDDDDDTEKKREWYDIEIEWWENFTRFTDIKVRHTDSDRQMDVDTKTKQGNNDKYEKKTTSGSIARFLRN